jgi:hypothetical protein
MTGKDLQIQAAKTQDTVASIIKSEIDLQIQTAKTYPRNVTKSLEKASSLVSISAEAAEECVYSLPRGGKNITGPSVRFAETLASIWGNLRVQARVLEVTFLG